MFPSVLNCAKLPIATSSRRKRSTSDGTMSPASSNERSTRRPLYSPWYDTASTDANCPGVLCWNRTVSCPSLIITLSNPAALKAACTSSCDGPMRSGSLGSASPSVVPDSASPAVGVSSAVAVASAAGVPSAASSAVGDGSGVGVAVGSGVAVDSGVSAASDSAVAVPSPADGVPSASAAGVPSAAAAVPSPVVAAPGSTTSYSNATVNCVTNFCSACWRHSSDIEPSNSSKRTVIASSSPTDTSTPVFPKSVAKKSRISSAVGPEPSNATVREDALWPGICIRMRSGGEPSSCTVGSLTPNSFTRRSTMVRIASTSSADGALPSSLRMS